MPDLSDLLNSAINYDGTTSLQDIANTVSKLPENVARFVTNPQAFTQLFGNNSMPQATGFAAGATGLSPQSPYGGGVLNPKNAGYEEGYQQGEPVAIAANFAPFVKGKPVGLSMIGPESATWNREMAFNAGKMEAKGATPQQIHETTGMVRGLDNQWRQEISDYYSKMKGENDFADTFRRGGLNGIWAKDKVTVKDVLDHPALFESYPHLGDITVETHKADTPVKGSYKQSKNTITVREDLNPEEAKSTLLHELTHAVQAKEGWNRGANYSQEVQKAQAQKEALMPDIIKLNEKMSDASKSGDNERYRYLMHQRDALVDKYLVAKPEDIGYENYRLHGGEAEARLVQARRNLKPEELGKHFPYQESSFYGLDIDPDKAIITSEHPSTTNIPSQEYDYRGTHKAAYKTDDGTTAPGHELNKTYPSDVYGPNGHKYYGMGDQMDKDTLTIMKAAKGKPDHPITVYRAVPAEHAGEDIHPGDWVTPNLDYAEKHGQYFDNGYHILEKTVPAKHIWTDANSLHEFGYDPTD